MSHNRYELDCNRCAALSVAVSRCVTSFIAVVSFVCNRFVMFCIRCGVFVTVVWFRNDCVVFETVAPLRRTDPLSPGLRQLPTSDYFIMRGG